jgi:hypothetical protein
MENTRPLAEHDLPEAQRIVRRAFGTFLGAPDLDTFWTDFDYVYGRFGAEHTVAFAADADGALAGVNFATRWGSVGFFGPISTRPDLWNRHRPTSRAGCVRCLRHLGCQPCRAVHFSAQHQACVAIPEVRVLPALSDAGHGGAGDAWPHAAHAARALFRTVGR